MRPIQTLPSGISIYVPIVWGRVARLRPNGGDSLAVLHCLQRDVLTDCPNGGDVVSQF
ncbi:MAG: hypothetical protein ACJAWC_000290 [Yoonia sp.]|jgi:hypothetical protein